MAWEPLGWRAAWVSEIEAFPSAVLAHHWPDVPNLGDMTGIAGLVRFGEVEAPDVLVGGTPCQSFSIAGMRGGISDPRGGLTLSYVELADAIDRVRADQGQPPLIAVWENVPGVLSSKDNAFGCFLASLAGDGEPYPQPADKRGRPVSWSDAGVVFGPKRAIAWRVVDAQFVGLAQRRRRVFVVASARNGFHPAQVLLEFDGVRRDTPPSREAREGTAGGFARSVALRGREGGGTAELGDDVQNCLRASSGGGDKPHVIAFSCKDHGGDAGPLSPTLRSMGHDGSHANAGGQVAVAHVQVAPTIRAGGNQTGGNRPPGTDVDTADSLLTTPSMQVRRLTPRECERLQGFPDDYTLIPWTEYRRIQKRGEKTGSSYEAELRRRGKELRGKPVSECPDGPRYKAIGNSMAVNVMRWLGRRIEYGLRRPWR